MGECLRIETSPAFRPEKEYCFHVLFRELLGLDYQVVFSDQAHYNLQLPGGERIVIEDHFFSGQKEDHYLLPENVPENACTFNSPFDGTPNTAIFGRNHFVFGDKEAVCGVDVFASAFFMLTRWEEYVLPHRDRHQRFPAEKSLAFKAGFLDRPVVNEYALLLRQMFARIGWKLPPQTRQYQLSITCDADHPRLWWTAASRAKTVAASLFKRGDWQEARYWLKNHVFYKKDPYDVFDEWMDLFEKKDTKDISIFWVTARLQATAGTRWSTPSSETWSATWHSADTSSVFTLPTRPLKTEKFLIKNLLPCALLRRRP